MFLIEQLKKPSHWVGSRLQKEQNNAIKCLIFKWLKRLFCISISERILLRAICWRSVIERLYLLFDVVIISLSVTADWSVHVPESFNFPEVSTYTPLSHAELNNGSYPFPNLVNFCNTTKFYFFYWSNFIFELVLGKY